MPDNTYWTEMTVLISALSALAGAGAKAFGDRLKLAHEDRQAERDRSVSERDMWQELGALRAEQQRLHQALHEAQQEAAKLRVEIAVLRRDNEQLRAQYQAVCLRGECARRELPFVPSASQEVTKP